jgi:hypothetical protein
MLFFLFFIGKIHISAQKSLTREELILKLYISDEAKANLIKENQRLKQSLKQREIEIQNLKRPTYSKLKAAYDAQIFTIRQMQHQDSILIALLNGRIHKDSGITNENLISSLSGFLNDYDISVRSVDSLKNEIKNMIPATEYTKLNQEFDKLKTDYNKLKTDYDLLKQNYEFILNFLSVKLPFYCNGVKNNKLQIEFRSEPLNSDSVQIQFNIRGLSKSGQYNFINQGRWEKWKKVHDIEIQDSKFKNYELEIKIKFNNYESIKFRGECKNIYEQCLFNEIIRP